MKHALTALLLCAAISMPCANAQTADDPNEGSRAEWDGVNSTLHLKWYGRQGRTYFIQHSTEGLDAFEYLPIIETGDDSVRDWGFSTNSTDVTNSQYGCSNMPTKCFLRLRWVDIPTTNAVLADFDGDGLGNMNEINIGIDPLNSDTGGDGVTDGVSLTLGINPLLGGYALGDSDNDGLDNLSEKLLGLDADNPDTDGDGIIDGQAYSGFPPASPYEGSSVAPDATNPSMPLREPVDQSDLDNDGWSNDDDTAPASASTGAPPGADIDFYGSSDQEFETWRTLLHNTVTGRTYIYKISGEVNYQNTGSSHYKDYGYVLDQGPYRENGLHWQSPVTFIDLDSGSPSADHTYYVHQTGNGLNQQVRPQDVKSQDLWRPGGGGPNGVADSYEDNAGALHLEVIRPTVNVVEYASYDDRWRPQNPTVSPQWTAFPANGMLFTGDDAIFEVDLGAPRLNSTISSVTCSITTQDGPQSGTVYGNTVSAEPTRAQFINIMLGGRVHVVADVGLQNGQHIMVDNYIELGIRTKSVSVIQWLDPQGIEPALPLPTCVAWAMAKTGQLGISSSAVLAQLNDKTCRLASTEWMLCFAADSPPSEDGDFSSPEGMANFLNSGASRYRLGSTFRLKFSPYRAGDSWVMKGTGEASRPILVCAGHTRIPVLSTIVPDAMLSSVVNDYALAYFLMGVEQHPTNFGALRRNTDKGNQRARLSAAARVGRVGQLINSVLWPNDVPWIFSNITFDAGRIDGVPVEDPELSGFPTADIYRDGVLFRQIKQTTVEAFLPTWNIAPPSVDP